MAQLKFPSINYIILSGRLVNDPTVRALPSGSKVLEFRIASNRRNGQREENLYINCIYTYTGDRVDKYSGILKTGYPIILEGRLRYREWTDQNNNRRSIYEIIVGKIHLLEKVELEEPVIEPPPDDTIEKDKVKINFDEETIDEDDIPF